MPSPRRLVLGTAGHIDHGKTALIRALTGIDTDRLPEEKARGITIDLGFAAIDLPEVGRLSVIDVPGHEGLVRTMVSGATGIDVLLLVVAADEGVMPQTREHVAICDLLGIERCVVALTKIDVADPDFIELASEEVAELLEATSLAGAPIVPVSAQTGDGIDALRDVLQKTAQDAAPRTTRHGPPRLGIDRVFAMRGFGTVVTGTLVGAPLEAGTTVAVLPGERTARVRGLQSHGDSVEAADPGSRCAINLQGLDVGDLGRGDVVSLPGRMAATGLADVALTWLASAPAAADSVAVEFLVGTAERRAHLAPIGTREFEPGARLFARLHVDGDPVAMLPGDRFIVRGFARTEGAGATLGGGVVLDVAPPHRRRSDPALARELGVLERAEPVECVYERVRRNGLSGVDPRVLVPQLGLERAALSHLLEALEADGRLIRAGANDWIDAACVARLEAELFAALDAFHRAEPMRPGMPRAALRGRLASNVPPAVSELAVERLVASGRFRAEAEWVALESHRPTLDAEARAATERIVAEARSAGLDPPNPADWAKQLGVDLPRFRDLVAHLEREGALLRAPGDLWFDRAAVDALCEAVRAHFTSEETLDTQQYKALIGTSRRTAMPLMELLDELHVTRRQGDVRILRARR